MDTKKFQFNPSAQFRELTGLSDNAEEFHDILIWTAINLIREYMLPRQACDSVVETIKRIGIDPDDLIRILAVMTVSYARRIIVEKLGSQKDSPDHPRLREARESINELASRLRESLGVDVRIIEVNKDGSSEIEMDGQ